LTAKTTLVRPSDDRRLAGGSRLAIAPRHATSVGMTMRLMVPAVRIASLPRMAPAAPTTPMTQLIP
jgi:hypothetical protein